VQRDPSPLLLNIAYIRVTAVAVYKVEKRIILCLGVQQLWVNKGRWYFVEESVLIVEWYYTLVHLDCEICVYGDVLDLLDHIVHLFCISRPIIHQKRNLNSCCENEGCNYESQL
jgi:hypothetical protein